MPKKLYVGVKEIMVKNKKALILKGVSKRRQNTCWDLPGGRIDDNETIEQTLMRELHEKLPSINNIIHKLLHAQRMTQDVNNELLLIFYKITADLKKIILSTEHTDYMWITKEDLKKIKEEENERLDDGTYTAIVNALQKT